MWNELWLLLLFIISKETKFWSGGKVGVCFGRYAIVNRQWWLELLAREWVYCIMVMGKEKDMVIMVWTFGGVNQ